MMNTITFEHDRRPITRAFGEAATESTVSIEAQTDGDLVVAVGELLDRMPDHLFDAFVEAVRVR